jgi:lipopolysaccharide/colanic/teichoic acid biosynthesis glycosyltransferase
MSTSALKQVRIDPKYNDSDSEHRSREAINRKVKRTFDILISVLLLVILTPVLICAATALLILEGLPVFFVSTRYIGLNRPVRVIKFRTMARDAQSPKYKLRERFMREGFLDIPTNCEVYTPIGRILERLQIVELPQLFNVIKDGMSLVGNRPLPKENLDLLSHFPEWQQRFRAPAGITGVSQIVGKLNLSPLQRLDLEARYGKVFASGNILKCDLLIMWSTVVRVLMRNEGLSLDAASAMLDVCLFKKPARVYRAPSRISITRDRHD